MLLLCYLQNYASFYDDNHWYCSPLGSYKRSLLDSYTNFVENYGQEEGVKLYNCMVDVSHKIGKLPIYKLALLFVRFVIKFLIDEPDEMADFDDNGRIVLRTLSVHVDKMMEMNELKDIEKQTAKIRSVVKE